MKIPLRTVFLAIILLGLWENSAQAARSSTVTQTNPTAPASVAMGSIGPITFRITNTNTGGQTGERIYEVRFRMAANRSTFSSTTAAPAGWTRTAYSTTSVTFQATSWANAISLGNFKDFSIVFVFRSTTADASETLRDVRSRYTSTTTGPPFSNAGNNTVSSPGSWTLKSLSITSFQITDLSGTPISSIASGTSFKLVLTVKNNSTASQSSIVASPNPPTATKTGTVTQTLTSTVYSPTPLTLAAGASGTITFTYSTSSTDNGTINFTAYVRNSGNTATSATATSTTLSVSRLTVSLALTPSCLFYSGTTATFTMTVTNSTGGSVSNVTPSALTKVTANGAVVGTFTGPAPASVASLSSGASTTFTWTATVSGTVLESGPKPSVYVTGFATYNGGLVTPVATSNTEDVDAYLVTVEPTVTNASSTNQEVTWTVINRGCAEVNSVSFSIPSGWTYANDAYSKVDLSSTNAVDTWTISGSGPVVFTASTIPTRIPIDFTGDFNLVFPTLPTSTGTTHFTVIIIDAASPPNTRTHDIMIDVNAFDPSPSGANATLPFAWQEQFP